MISVNKFLMFQLLNQSKDNTKAEEKDTANSFSSDSDYNETKTKVSIVT